MWQCIGYVASGSRSCQTMQPYKVFFPNSISYLKTEYAYLGFFYSTSCCGTQVLCIHQISGELNPAALNMDKSNKSKAILPSINIFTWNIIISKLKSSRQKFRKETFTNIKKNLIHIVVVNAWFSFLYI